MSLLARLSKREKIIAASVFAVIIISLIASSVSRFTTPKMLQGDELGGGAEYRVPLSWEEEVDGESYSLMGMASVGPEWFGKRAVRVDVLYKIGKNSSDIVSILSPVKGSGDCFASLSLDSPNDNEWIAQPVWSFFRAPSSNPSDCKWLMCKTESAAMDFTGQSYQGTLCFQAWTDACYFERDSTDEPVSFSFQVNYPSDGAATKGYRRYCVDLAR